MACSQTSNHVSLQLCQRWLLFLQLKILEIKIGLTSYHRFRRHLDGWAKRSEITVFVWDSDGKYPFSKIEFPQFMNRNVKILGRRLYSSSLNDICSVAKMRSINFSNFPYICL